MHAVIRDLEAAIAGLAPLADTDPVCRAALRNLRRRLAAARRIEHGVALSDLLVLRP